MNLYKAQGIVVKKNDRVNGDREIWIVTEFDSVIKLLAKGIRKSKKREIYSTDLMSEGEFIYYPSGVISKLELINGFTHLKSDLNKIQASLYVLSIFNEMFLPGEVFLNIFKTIKEALESIEKAENKCEVNVNLLHFLVAVIKYQGLMPGSFDFNESSDIIMSEERKIQIDDIDNKILFLEKYLSTNIGLKTRFASFVKGII